MSNINLKNYRTAIENLVDSSVKDDKVLTTLEKNVRATLGALPDKMYRYRTINPYTLTDIIEQTIFLAPPDMFDDKLDTRYVLTDAEEKKLIKDLKKKGSKRYKKLTSEFHISPTNGVEFKDYEISNVIAEVVDKYNDECRKRVRISCFTQKIDNIPMWYYYADKHQGICMEYDFSKLSSFDKIGYSFLPVIYPGKNKVNKLYKFDENCSLKSFFLNSLIKTRDWNFEEEWRIIKETKYVESKATEGESVIDEKETIIHLPIKAIYFGTDISLQSKLTILNLLDKNKMNIKLYDMKLTEKGLHAEEHNDVLVPVDNTKTDIVKAFKQTNVFEWKQPSKKIKTGDIVYIYIGQDVQEIRYKCRVLRCNMRKISKELHEYFINKSILENDLFMELSLIEEYPAGTYTFQKMKEAGCTTISSLRYVKDGLKTLLGIE